MAMQRRQFDAVRMILLCLSIFFVVVRCHESSTTTGTISEWNQQSSSAKEDELLSYSANREDSLLSLRTLNIQEPEPPKQKSSSTSPTPAPQPVSHAPAVDNGSFPENNSSATVSPTTEKTKNQTATSATLDSEGKNVTGPSVSLSLEAFSVEILADMGIRKGDVDPWIRLIRDELRKQVQSYLLQDLSQRLDNLVYVRLQNFAGTRRRALQSSSSSEKTVATFDYTGEAVFAKVAPTRASLIDQQRESLRNIQAIQNLMDSNDLLKGVRVKSIERRDSIPSTQDQASSNGSDNKLGVDTQNLILGGAIAAGVVVAALVAFLVCCICKKRRRRREALRKNQEPSPPPLPLPNTSEISSENGSPTKLSPIIDTSYAEDESSLVSADDIMADLEEIAKARPNAYLQLKTGGANGDIVAQVVRSPRNDAAASSSAHEKSTDIQSTGSSNSINVFRHRSFEHDVEAQELMGDTMNSRIVSIAKSRSQDAEDSDDDNRRPRRPKTASSQRHKVELNSKGVLTATKNSGDSQVPGTNSSQPNEEQMSSSIGRKSWMLPRYPWSTEKTPKNAKPPRNGPVEEQGKIVWNKRGMLSIGKATQNAESTYQTPNIVNQKPVASEDTDKFSNKANSEVHVNKKGLLSITKSSPDEDQVTSSLQATPVELSETPQQYGNFDDSLGPSAAENSLLQINKKGVLSISRTSRTIEEGVAAAPRSNQYSSSSDLQGLGTNRTKTSLARHETPDPANSNLRINSLGLLTVSKPAGVTGDSSWDTKKRSTPDTLDVKVAETPSAVQQNPPINTKQVLSKPLETPVESFGKGNFYSPVHVLQTGSTDSMDGYSLSGGIVESNHGTNVSRIPRPTPQPSWMLSKGQNTVTPSLGDDYNSDAESDFTYGDVGHGERNTVVAALLSNSIDSEDTSDYLLKELNDESMLVLKEKGSTAASKATHREHSYPSPDYPVTSYTQSHLSASESMFRPEKVSDDESFDYLPTRQKSTKGYETSLSHDLHYSHMLTKGYEPSSSSIELDSSVPASLYSAGKYSYDDQSQPFDETSVDYGSEDGNSVERTRSPLGVRTKNLDQTSRRAMVTPDGDIDVNPSDRRWG